MDITLTDLQLKALRRIDAALAPKQILQVHVETWLTPLVAQMEEDERKEVAHAYVKADKPTRVKVRADLGLL